MFGRSVRLKVLFVLCVLLLAPAMASASPANPAGPADTYTLYLPYVGRDHCPDFFDDFSNPASGWPVGDRPDLLYGYLGGEYQVQTKVAGFIFVVPAPTCTRQSYTVEADMRWEGEPGSYYGLAFGNIPGTQLTYAFLVSSQRGQYILLRRDAGAWVQLVGLTSSAAIRPGNETNTLRAIRNGSQITLQVNGVTLGTWTDATLTGPTGTGLLIYKVDGSPFSEARYDDYRVTSVSGSGLGQPGFAFGRPAAGQDAAIPLDDVWRLPPLAEPE
jgi:hypothetical protein